MGRSVWTLVDQAASSSSNFVVSLSVLAVADRGEFAAFSVALTGFLLVTQLARSTFSLPVLILYSGETGETAGRSAPAVAASVATGVVGALAFVLAGVAYEEGRTLFFVLACGLPFLQYQDGIRHVAFARGLPKVAAQSDLSWIGLQVGAIAVAAAVGQPTPAALVVIWVAAGSISGLVFGARLGVVPRFGRCKQWLADNKGLCTRMATEFLVNSGSYYALCYGLVAVAGADQLGSWRAAQALIGPVSVLLMGGTTLGVPESVRVRDRHTRLWLLTGLLSVGLAVIAIAGGALVYAVLPGLGPELFPDTWRTARPVLPVLTLYAAAVGASTGAVAALRAREQTHWIVVFRAVSGAGALALGLALATRSGAIGALTGLCVSEALFGVAAWVRLARTMSQPLTESEPSTPRPPR